LSADAINQIVAGLPPGIKEAVGGAIATGIGAVVGGGAGATSAVNADFNNRQLHPSEIALSEELAKKSGGKYTAAEIREQMRLMGNEAYQELPDTITYLTDIESIKANIFQDPSMPKGTSSPTVYEIPGKADLDIQKYIVKNTKDGVGFIPGVSPYVLSDLTVGVQPRTKLGELPKLDTSKCANGDLACLSGVGAQLPPLMTADQQKDAGEYFGELSFQYQRASGLALLSGNPQLATSFEIAAGVSALLEQALLPSNGKVLVDTILVDSIAEAFSRATKIPLVLVNEVVERDIKPRLQRVRALVDKSTGLKR